MVGGSASAIMPAKHPLCRQGLGVQLMNTVSLLRNSNTFCSHPLRKREVCLGLSWAGGTTRESGTR